MILAYDLPYKRIAKREAQLTYTRHFTPWRVPLDLLTWSVKHATALISQSLHDILHKELKRKHVTPQL